MIAGDDKPKARGRTQRTPREPPEISAGLGSGRVERRMAALLALDIRNYSLMISLDEPAAHKRVGRDLAAVVKQIHKHGGHVLQFAGDGLLAEFPGASQTLHAALDVQSAARRRNLRRPAEHAIEYRIGINVGEIFEQNSRVGGDTINIAARLEQIAEPGGICISEAVHAEVHDTVKAAYINIGPARLKNIRYPVGIYRVSTDPRTMARGPLPGQFITNTNGIWDYRPSIAILPLENVGGEAESDYFSDGVVEDLIISLSGLRELRVISRSSTLGYKSGRTDVREVGRTLGVGYVLSGRIRRTAAMIRASVELSETQAGVSVWAESAEFPPGDLFEMQDHLVRRIAARIAPQIQEEELRRAMRRHPESMTAYDLTLQALHLMDYLDRDTFGHAKVILQQAMSDDPNFAMPVVWSVWWHVIWVGQSWSTDPDSDYVAAATLAERAVALDPNNALGLAMMGHFRSFLMHDYDGALLFFARALAAGPGNAIALALHALTLAYIGRGEEAVRLAHQALELSPLDQRLFLFHNILAWANFAAGRYDEAVQWARASESAAPRLTANLRVLIGSLAATGAHEEARAVAAKLLSLEQDFTLARYERTLLPYHHPGVRTHFLACLRAAGLPN